MIPAFVMGPSKWKSILMFDKPIVFRERRVVSREGVTHLERRPFLVRYTCACAYAHAHPYWQTWKGMKRLRVTLAPETGRARAVTQRWAFPSGASEGLWFLPVTF